MPRQQPVLNPRADKDDADMLSEYPRHSEEQKQANNNKKCSALSHKLDHFV